MQGYTPLFGEIITSSIWNEDDQVRIIWITLLALSDKDGNVMASISGLAPVARVSLSQCEKAIETLSSPDKYSRSLEKEGRRIEVIDGGWHIINHEKYRNKAKSRATYMRKYRASKSQSQKQVNKQAKSKPPNLEEIQQYLQEHPQYSSVDAQAFYDYYTTSGWIDSKGNKVKNWKQKIITWSNHNGRKGIQNSRGPVDGGDPGEDELEHEWTR